MSVYLVPGDRNFRTTMSFVASKKYAEPLLKAVREEEPSYMTAQRILAFLQFFRQIDDDHIIVNNSILREFIGGSIFVE